jgi:predicted metal-dependent hydrolase
MACRRVVDASWIKAADPVHRPVGHQERPPGDLHSGCAPVVDERKLALRRAQSVHSGQWLDTSRADVPLPGIPAGYLGEVPSEQSASADAVDAVDTAAPTGPEIRVDVRRSARRTRTVSAYREGDTIVVMIPARMTRAEEREWVDTMVARVTNAERRRRPSDEALLTRAKLLSDRYLEGKCTPSSVRWVDNQLNRWGSCTPADRTIRLSTRMQGMPSYVVDYVLVHELAHLLIPGHGKAFWDLVERYELTERARGYLEGTSAAASLGTPDADE